MVKSGEVHISKEQCGDSIVLDNQDSRPRNICIPSASTCGMLTSI